MVGGGEAGLTRCAMLKVNAAPRQAPKLVWEEFLSFFFSPSLFTFLPFLYFIRLSFLFSLLFIYHQLKNTAWRNYSRFTNSYPHSVRVTLHARPENFRLPRENVTNLFSFAFRLAFVMAANDLLKILLSFCYSNKIFQIPYYRQRVIKFIYDSNSPYDSNY